MHRKKKKRTAQNSHSLNIILLYIDAYHIHKELHRTLMTQMLAALFMVFAS